METSGNSHIDNIKRADLATKEFCNKFAVRYNRSMELYR